MGLGMFVGGWLSTQLPAEFLRLGIVYHLVGMTGGMLFGMLAGHELLWRVLSNSNFCEK